MGTSQNRATANPEDIVYSQEQNIPFVGLDVSNIDLTIHHFMVGARLNKEQLNVAFGELRIPDIDSFKKPLKSLFMNFFDGETNDFNAIQISTLGILLGESEASRKTELLFQNYDEDSSEYIDVEELQVLIRDIIEISLVHIPHYALCCLDDSNKHNIIKYNFILKTMSGILSDYFYMNFETGLDKKKNHRLNLAMFRQAFRDPECSQLINSSSLRKLAYQKYLSISKPAGIVIKYIEEPETFNSDSSSNEIFRRFAHVRKFNK